MRYYGVYLMCLTEEWRWRGWHRDSCGDWGFYGWFLCSGLFVSVSVYVCLSVPHIFIHICRCITQCWLMCVCILYVFQIDDIRISVDKVDESITEIKKLYSTILSAPTSDQSNCFWHTRTLIMFTHISPSLQYSTVRHRIDLNGFSHCIPVYTMQRAL